jgi:GDP-mannose 6-dehydrogenase
MRVSVFGVGYVGAVSSACLAAAGHAVIGVDVAPAKVDLLNQGRSPIVESLIGELIAQGVRQGRLTATLRTGS